MILYHTLLVKLSLLASCLTFLTVTLVPQAGYANTGREIAEQFLLSPNYPWALQGEATIQVFEREQRRTESLFIRIVHLSPTEARILARFLEPKHKRGNALLIHLQGLRNPKVWEYSAFKKHLLRVPSEYSDSLLSLQLEDLAPPNPTSHTFDYLGGVACGDQSLCNAIEAYPTMTAAYKRAVVSLPTTKANTRQVDFINPNGQVYRKLKFADFKPLDDRVEYPLRIEINDLISQTKTLLVWLGVELVDFQQALQQTSVRALRLQL